MAYENYSVAAINKIMPKIKMYEATHKKRISQTLLDSLIRQELEVGASRDYQNQQLALSKEELALRKKAYEDQADADAAAGVGDTVTGLGMTYLGYKYLTKDAATKGLATKGLTDAGIGESALSGGIGLGGEAGLADAAFGEGALEGGLGLGGQAQAAGSLPAAAQTAAVATPATTTTATTAAATTGGGGSATGLGAVGLSNVALPLAGAGITTTIARSLGASDVEEGIVGAATGAGIGAYLAAGTSVGGPLGAVVGGVIGIGVSLIDDSVICTYLHETGRLDDSTYKHSNLYLRKYIAPDVYFGYRAMADPLIRMAKRNRLVDAIVVQIGRGMAGELAHRIRPRRFKGRLFGKLVLGVGVPLCKAVYRKNVNRGMEVCHG